MRRWISELNGRHKGEPIWISGTDPTIDGFPDGFERGRILITLNSAHFRFPEATYTYSNEFHAVARLAKADPDYAAKAHLFAWPLRYIVGVKQPNWSTATDELVAGWLNIYWLKLIPYPPRERQGDILGKIGWDGMKAKAKEAIDGTITVFGGYRTCLHACVQAALLMGGNPVNIIGCGHRMFGKRFHFGADGEREKAGDYTPPGCPHKPEWDEAGGIVKRVEGSWKHKRRGTAALKQGAAEAGVMVNRVKSCGHAAKLGLL